MGDMTMTTNLSQLDGGVLRWEPPPEASPGTRGPQTRQWQIVALQLRANPGRWGVICEDNNYVIDKIKRGIGPWKPAGDFESVQRTVGGIITVYARYIGDDPIVINVRR